VILALLLQAGLLVPAVPEAFARVCVWGDSQNGVATFRQVVASMVREAPTELFTVGDVTQDRCALPQQWVDQFLAPLAPLLALPRRGVLGNHDCPALFAQHVNPLPTHLPGGLGLWGAETRGSVRWIYLDANQDNVPPPGAPEALRTSMFPGGPQRAFLVAELASPARAAARWTIAAFHQTPVTERWDRAPCAFGRTSTRVENVPWIQAMDLMAAAGVPLVLVGHAHALQHGDWRGMAWACSGGGGGGLDLAACTDQPEVTWAASVHGYHVLDVTAERLELTAKGVDGTALVAPMVVR